MADPRAVTAARNIRMLLLDVDGVLTDGRLYYGESGDEFKSFNTKDGLGIKLLQRAGIEVGIITARTSQLVARRCRELGIKRVIQGSEDKMVALNELIKELPIAMQQIAYIGDDLPDLGPVKNVGLGMTVADANYVLKENALWCAQAPGGFGAVREAAEFILTAQNKLQALIQSHQ